MEATSLADLLAPAQYRSGREHIFPSDGSLQWYVRRHKTDLIRCKALLLHANRWVIHAVRFDDYVTAAATAAAAAAK